MKSLFVDCPTGISGDMLLAAFLDLGVPQEVIESPLYSLGLGESYSLRYAEGHSLGIRGITVSVDPEDQEPPHRKWKDIKALILNSSIERSLIKKVLRVFELLAEAEAAVHGEDVDEVHFHEIGAIDSLVDILGVCAALEYLNVNQIVCGIPPAGYGTVKTAHGFLPVPVPAVLEIARRKNITLKIGEDIPKGELTTPTGLALMAELSDAFGVPSFLNMTAIGIGLGHRILDRPNFLRLCLLDDLACKDINELNGSMKWQPLISQEAWVDDSTPEEIAYFCKELRSFGVIDVISSSIQMKKGRQGFAITALVSPDKAKSLRLKWLQLGPTLGLRESSFGRWILPRRSGVCRTSKGEVAAKQVRRPDGSITIKAEHDDLVRLSIQSGHPIEVIKREFLLASLDFLPQDDWHW